MTAIGASIISSLGDKSSPRSTSRRKTMADAVRSKKQHWGPSHSADSDDTAHSQKKLLIKNQSNSPGNTETTKTSSTDEDDLVVTPLTQPQLSTAPSSENPIGRFLESAASMVGFSDDKKESKKVLVENDSLDTLERHAHFLADSICSPCKNAFEQDACFFPSEQAVVVKGVTENLKRSPSSTPSVVSLKRSVSSSTPAERRRQRHAERQLQQAKQNAKPLPLDTLELKSDSFSIARSISELTMKSSYGEATAKLSENRRMAYYAVGKHHKNNAGRGGNRRCYFTGKLILGGAPFYAGSVQQGLRTLVVFCLPSAVGLPKGVENSSHESVVGSISKLSHAGGSVSKLSQQTPAAIALMRSASRESSIGVVPTSSTKLSSDAAKQLGIIRRLRTRSTNGSRVSGSIDDMSLSIVEEDLDPNWGLDRDYLLQHLPDPSEELLQEMEERYPEQFETLPVQVRSPHCWRLFCKFCFFSGLPIAEGEMHYKVRDEVAMEVYGEEIILSHDVMEAVNGESAEILRLPNQKTFRYLRKHYTQQSGKLSDAVFCRKSWELVRPEI